MGGWMQTLRLTWDMVAAWVDEAFQTKVWALAQIWRQRGKTLHGIFTGASRERGKGLAGPCWARQAPGTTSITTAPTRVPMEVLLDSLGVSQTPANSDSSLNPVMFVDLV